MARPKRLAAKVNIPICLAGVLFCMTLFSFHLSGGVYARYTTTATGSDSARVAKFEVTEGGTIMSDAITADLIPGSGETRTLEVVNKSEVTIQYSVSLTNETGNLPLDISLAKTEGAPADGSDYDVLDVGEAATYTVFLHWPAEYYDPEYSGKIDLVRIILTAEQMD